MAYVPPTLAAAHDTRIDHNRLYPHIDPNSRAHSPSDQLSFSIKPHRLVWHAPQGEYDNIMKNSYFALSDRAIERSKQEQPHIAPQEILQEMQHVAGERNVPHFLNYPADDAEGTISNLMIKERNYQKYMENPGYIREMLADAFLIKIANDGVISERDRDELIRQAGEGANSAELHDMMARMTYNDPKSYHAFKQMLMESESLYAEIKAGDAGSYGFITTAYDEHYAVMAETVLKLHSEQHTAERFGSDGTTRGIYDPQTRTLLPFSDLLSGEQMQRVAAVDALFKELNRPLQEAPDSPAITTLDMMKDFFENNKDHPLAEAFGRIHLEDLNLESTAESFDAAVAQMASVEEFSQAHDASHSRANEVVYQMHKAARFDQNPFLFLEVPEVGEQKIDGGEYSKSDVNEAITYNKSLIASAISGALEKSEYAPYSTEIAENIVHDLYAENGAYRKAIRKFVDESQNDPMTMTVFSDLNSVATTIVRDAIYNELMDIRFKEENPSNSIYQELMDTGAGGDRNKVIHVSEKISTGSYLSTIDHQKMYTDRVVTLMNKATLFSKISTGEINAKQSGDIIDKTAIFRDMQEEEREALRKVSDDIFEAKNRSDMASYYDIDDESRRRFLDDSVTKSVFDYIESSDDRMMPGMSRLFRNNRAYFNFVRCGQSGSVKDRNAESVANNLKSCMENYRRDIEEARERKDEMARQVLSTPFGAMNGLVAFLVILEQLFGDMEYQRSRRALNQMHHTILNDLAFRRASPDIQAEKARSAILSATANGGITNTNVAHAVSDKYQDSIMKENLAKEVFNASMNDTNLFLHDTIDAPELSFRAQMQQQITTDLESLLQQKSILNAQYEVLKEDVSIVSDASNINMETLKKELDQTQQEWSTITKILEEGSSPNHEELVAQRDALQERLTHLQEQRDIYKKSITIQADGSNVIENSRNLRSDMDALETKIQEARHQLEVLTLHQQEFNAINDDSVSTLIAKSKILQTYANDIVLQSDAPLEDSSLLEKITASRTILALAILKKSAEDDAINAIESAFDVQFSDTSHSGLYRAKNALGVEGAPSNDKVKLLNALSGNQYKALYDKIKETPLHEREALYKQEEKLFKEILQQSRNDTKKHAKVLDFIESQMVARELERDAVVFKKEAEAVVQELRRSSKTQQVDVVAGKLKDLSSRFIRSQENIINRAKHTLTQLDDSFNYLKESEVERRISLKSDLVHEAKMTGFKNKIDRASNVIKTLYTINNADTGNTHDSVIISNHVTTLFDGIQDRTVKKELLHSSGVEIREFENKSHDNTTSMLLLTDLQSVYLERARKIEIERGNHVQVDIIDRKLKEHVLSKLSYNIDGVESWGKNAKDKDALRTNGVSAQEAQRQVRSAMLH